MMCFHASCQFWCFHLALFTIYRYNSLYAYGQSKLANILHAKELAKRLQLGTQYIYLRQLIIHEIGISLVVPSPGKP